MSYLSKIRGWLWGGAVAPVVTAAQATMAAYNTRVTVGTGQGAGHSLQLLRQWLNNSWLFGSAPLEVLRRPLATLLKWLFSKLPSSAPRLVNAIYGPSRELFYGIPAAIVNGWFNIVDHGVVGVLEIADSGFLALSSFVLNNVVAMLVGGVIRRIFKRQDSTFLQIDSYFEGGPRRLPATAEFSSEWRVAAIRGVPSLVADILSTLLLNPVATFTWPITRLLTWVRPLRTVARYAFYAVTILGSLVTIGPMAITLMAWLAGLQAVSIPLSFLGIGFTGTTSAAHLAVLSALTTFVAYWKYRMATGVTVKLALGAVPQHLRLVSLEQTPVSNQKMVSIANDNEEVKGRKVSSPYLLEKWILARLPLPAPVDAGLRVRLSRIYDLDAHSYDRHALRQALFRIQLGMMRSGAALTHLDIELPRRPHPLTGYAAALQIAYKQWQGMQLQTRVVQNIVEWLTPYERTRQHSAGVVFTAIAPFLLKIQSELLGREIDHYIVTQAPVAFAVRWNDELGNLKWEITLILRPRELLSAEFGAAAFTPEYDDFIKVRELPGARIFLTVSPWRDLRAQAIRNADAEPAFTIVLRFLHNLCLTCRWYLVVPWLAGVQGDAAIEAIPSMRRVPAIGNYRAGYMSMETPAESDVDTPPGISADKFEAMLMDRLLAAPPG